MMMIKVLFVCMGNICRSPTAEGVFSLLVKNAKLSEQFYIDSAGTHAYHVGSPADLRSQEAALKRGIDLSDLCARQVTLDDFTEFDYILAMDKENYQILRMECPSEYVDKLHLFLSFAPEIKEQYVPDPYLGGSNGFEHVLNLVEAASRGLLEDCRQRL